MNVKPLYLNEVYSVFGSSTTLEGSSVVELLVWEVTVGNRNRQFLLNIVKETGRQLKFDSCKSIWN